MLALLLAFFGGARGLISAGLFAASVAGLLYYVHEYDQRGDEIVRLERAVADAKNRGVVLETNLKLLDGTVASLNARLAERSGNLEEFCKLLGEVQASTDPKDDEEVGGTAVPKVFERLRELNKDAAP